MNQYILGGDDGRTPVEVGLMQWARWFEGAGDKRIVARTTLPGGVRVSTVFVGLPRWDEDPPQLFETMVFTPTNGGSNERHCATWAEAEAQHAAVVESVTRGITDDEHEAQH